MRWQTHGSPGEVALNNCKFLVNSIMVLMLEIHDMVRFRNILMIQTIGFSGILGSDYKRTK